MEKINIRRRPGSRADCLNFIRKSFDEAKFKDLTSGLDRIFYEESKGGSHRACLRLRLGKETGVIFDKVLKFPNYTVYQKLVVTSPRSSSSLSRTLNCQNTCSSINMSLHDQRDKYGARRVDIELQKLDLDDREYAAIMYELNCDAVKREFFLNRKEEGKRGYVIRMLKMVIEMFPSVQLDCRGIPNQFGHSKDYYSRLEVNTKKT
ncbi:uncharacterized protein LOC141664104 [Apium graveolens]|uniref:uncharacterized protein LOC141664104 n=1 Tax=Apium graveolens TaxID=4045 RepID=UPI003D7C0735